MCLQIHKCQKLSKAQAFHMSEDEKKRRKRNKIVSNFPGHLL